MKQPPKKENKDLTFQVTQPTELLNFLIEKIHGKSRNSIKSLLTHKQIKVGNKVVSQYNHPLNQGDIVKVTTVRHEEKKLIGLRIVYEDKYVIVIDKDPGVLSIATETEKRGTAYSILSEYVKEKHSQNRIFVLHRLDRETSGLMMFAKDQETQGMLQHHWDRSVRARSYVALVEGQVNQPQDTIVSWLKEGKTFVVHSSPIDNGGQKAVTNYRVLKNNRYYSLLALDLETGRKNQIRVHMQSIGHPVVGDKKYGATHNPIRRVGLHAMELSFIHPITNQLLEFSTPIPKKFTAVFGAEKSDVNIRRVNKK
ncbi:RluA family pseudouridine synthase [Parabacteroides sp. FAFU027]|uniref:RluA family pseudouridine synthase n=1 Tax=Parabacteroides sp. FAFU027 TaxID=2922715 RepID=UPI001FAEE3FE|nr:RluA family pseudouridine synthase [Parabacteroides sp. FAFU027]